jgi:hypothetical protein
MQTTEKGKLRETLGRKTKGANFTKVDMLASCRKHSMRFLILYFGKVFLFFSVFSLFEKILEGGIQHEKTIKKSFN